MSNLSEEEAIELGSKIGALIGLGFEGEEGMEAGAAAGAEEAAAEGGVHVFTEEEGRRRLGCAGGHPRRLRGSAHLARASLGGCRCATRSRAWGFRISDGFISPLVAGHSG